MTMGYTANDIRNICLLGHGGDGKSALCESMLFTTKAITRLGKRADGTTVSDFDDEEKKRQYSISTSVIPVEKVRHYFHRGRLTACVDQVTGLGDFLELEILTESEEGRSAALTEIEEVLRQIGHSMEDTTRISYLSQLCSKLESEI